jgi:predicted amidophosphoribosyltransferase
MVQPISPGLSTPGLSTRAALPEYPLAGDGIAACAVCSGALHDGFGVCYCCATLAGQLQLPLTPLVAMVDYRLADPMHRRLRGYKDAPVAEARRVYLRQLVGFVSRWMTDLGGEPGGPFGGAWDTVATVPSSRRPGAPPVDAIVARVPRLGHVHRRLLVRGPVRVDHLAADRRGFVPAPGVDAGRLRHQRVLVVDDSVTTGARAQSAAAALRIGGATVVGILAIGRVVTEKEDPARSEMGFPGGKGL